MKLNRQGFITHYLISGPKEVPFIDHTSDGNQLKYEKYLRSIVTDFKKECLKEEVWMDTDSELSLPWEYYYSYGNWFVDKSSFYSSLTKIDLVAAVHLATEEEITVAAYLWSYAAVQVWLNDSLAAELKEPVYKPVKRVDMKMKLNKGVNRIYIRMQNLGVRDTRNIFGIQILERTEQIRVELPDSLRVKPFLGAEQWLSEITLSGRRLLFPYKAMPGTAIGYDSKNPDVTLGDKRVAYEDISGLDELELKKDNPYVIITVPVSGKKLSRKFEILCDIKPLYLNKDTFEENMEEIYRRISEVVKLDRGENIGFSMFNILARHAVNRIREDDDGNIYETLAQIEGRMDCADFLVCSFIRYIKNYEISPELQKRAKEVLLNFRYWMDEKGSDAMCFWSENHSLMFYVSAMNAGEMYPDEIFTRSGLTGRKLYEQNRRKVMEWIEDVEKYGFEEFLSGIYMCITFIALLNVIDFTEDAISKRAAALVDKIFYVLSIHTFKGSVIAPQGRVYRDVIYPFMQGLQSLINMLNPKNPYSYGEGWLGFYATSKYQLPFHMVPLMDNPVKTEYKTGNALIRLNKTRNYILTSVQSPREDGFKRWENVSFLEECDTGSHEYIKSLNERFHGTTCFKPGVYGYQQHMWSAALSPDTLVFVNHPGGPCDESSLRPGYWFGNGVMPAVKQIEQAIASIYVIPEEHPIDFTHIHWASCRFEEMKEENDWLIGKKGDGYLGIWSSGIKEPYNDQLFDAEYRIYDRKAAYFCVCSDTGECGDLEGFYQFCLSYQPVFHMDSLVLTANKDFVLKYEKAEDQTQFI
ncbi:hypothetical protein [Anaerocolumna jejuensis]|uniref:hypothetical protein n=1 Tax=Anaerocolumna jejuensis TaxID=259063 RepID=UPI003F7B7B1B